MPTSNGNSIFRALPSTSTIPRIISILPTLPIRPAPGSHQISLITWSTASVPANLRFFIPPSALCIMNPTPERSTARTRHSLTKGLRLLSAVLRISLAMASSLPVCFLPTIPPRAHRFDAAFLPRYETGRTRKPMALSSSTARRRTPGVDEPGPDNQALDKQPPIQSSHISPHGPSFGVGSLDAVRPDPVSQHGGDACTGGPCQPFQCGQVELMRFEIRALPFSALKEAWFSITKVASGNSAFIVLTNSGHATFSANQVTLRYFACIR